MEDNDALVDYLKRNGFLKSKEIESAFRKVLREEFTPPNLKDQAYIDSPLPIGSGQTISAPHMVAIMTELLKPDVGDKILEIGTGSGYQAAILSRLAGEVITLENVKKLAFTAEERLKPYHNVRVLHGDGSRGYVREAPYDKIIITCAAPNLPEALPSQLKEGGVIVVPIGKGYIQTLYRIKKREGKLEYVPHGSVMFVPLTEKID